MTSPAVASGRVVAFASRDGSLYSLALPTSREKQTLLAVDKDRVSGSLLTIPKPTLRFQLETDDRIVAPIALANGRIYMVTQNIGGSRIYCVDANSGKLRWAVPTGFPVYHKPQVIGDQLFVATSHGGMYCLSAETGMEIWRHSKSVEFLAATPNVVFASDVVNNIVLLNREDGTPMGKLPLRNFSVRIENDRTDRVIISTESGLVVCIHEKGREFPLYHMHPDRKPIVPEFAAAVPAAPEPADDSDDGDSE